MKFFKKFWWLFLIGFLVGGFLVYRSNTAKAASVKSKTFIVKKIDLKDTLSISGQIDASEKANLQFQTSGLLTWVGVKEGDYVKKFQVIASLDKRELQNQMSQLLNNYLTNRWNFEQGQADNSGWQTNGMTDAARATVQRTLEKSQFSLNNAVLNVEAQDLTLKFANLWTPIEGLVTGIDTPNSGVNVTPTSANFMIINPKTIYFSATADQTDVGKFSIGQNGQLVLDAFPDSPIDAQVTMIGFTPMAGETGTVYEIRLMMNVDNLDYKFKMGMTGDTNFTFKEYNGVLSIPEAYIIKDSGKLYVNKVVNNSPVKTEITTGDTIDGNTIILSGVSENDPIYY